MTNRENALLVYAHKSTDRIPSKLTDFNIIRPVAYLDRYQGTGTGRDGFGVEWIYEKQIGAPMPVPGKILFEEIEEWRKYVTIPDLQAIDWEKQSKIDMSQSVEGNLNLALSINGPFERMHACMGMTNALCALVDDPEECSAFVGAIADYKIEIVKMLGTYYDIDVFNLMDDYGTDDRMFMSPDLWRQIFKPHLQRIVNAVHEQGMLYQHHSCGYIEPIIGDLVEIGVDALDPLQVSNKNIRKIKDKYQDKLTICGGFDNQNVFDKENVSYEECYNESMRTFELLAPGGSYIAYTAYALNNNYVRGFQNALDDYNQKVYIKKTSLKKHYELNGKIEIISRAKLKTKDDLSLFYTPGVAEPCLEIQRDIRKSYELTRRSNLVAVVTDGTAVLGLGDIGPEAGMPVMEGKCMLFKELGGVDAFPLCIRSRDADTIVEVIAQIAGSFGGINLEDIAAPRCFEIEEKLKQRVKIPVFHDDQHGTAVIVLAGVINALKLTGRKKEECKVVINGAGAAGIAIAKLLLRYGFTQMLICDSQGIIADDDLSLNTVKAEIAKLTNHERKHGSLEMALMGADIFIGVSVPDIITPEMVQTMNQDAIIFAMANPAPEIMPGLAKAAGAAVVGTGRSDFPNQVNNVMVFPGMFRGALDVRAREINEEMKIAAAHAIAETISDDEIQSEKILPDPLDARVFENVSRAVREAAVKTGVAGKALL